ncbi:tRNA dimethylallyltransferase [Spirochaeta thermophila DSM 6578]|uniref:tRNA dimethylallyltransferase n=1 Tax=Winmispira thermophila (strain ATCC 700085 / DSM 6578 / Z-1203) TaxID=869211 RepID=G0GEW7_WINT7|nr:tRNA (adenosine(37)-N6)-dimethylallyltransferase MiaA [Spirochaeta thermophila]AEJ61523.1 tRNA dimethylallyltransferase [Spirochaeta thermophila DSM 6578]
MKRPRIPVVVLLGPTGVGKTDLLADLLPGAIEVVSADAFQVYRGMDIGTAKPSPELRKRVSHHLIDIRDPHEQYTVGDFVKEADAVIPEIVRRGKLPVVSGGTAYYLRHFLFGLPATPPVDEEARSRVAAFMEEAGIERAYERLKEVDPLSASRISPQDGYRISRALEVWEQTGRPLSSFPMMQGPRQEYDVLLVGLSRAREELRERIERRVWRMFEEGLADEVARLRARGYTAETPGMRAIGYREFFDHEGAPLEEIAAAIVLHTRQFAKRQLTFFRSFPGVHWFSAGEPEELSRLVHLVEKFSSIRMG